MIRGRDGRTLAEVWDGSPEAYLGSTVAGFPNLFLSWARTPPSATPRSCS